MLNPIAEKLINDLRFDRHTREHFCITDWFGANTCKTVGCIAGTAIAMEIGYIPAPFTGFDHLEHGQRILGISSKENAEQLFMPLEFWICELGGTAFEHLSANEKPSIDYIQEMKKFASKIGNVYNSSVFSPESCARTLELHLKDEIPYIDWMRGYNERNDCYQEKENA